MKSMSIGALIGTVASVFVVAIGGGLLAGKMIKKQKEIAQSTPVLDISAVKITKEKNNKEATYYTVEGIKATTKAGDPVELTLHDGSATFSPDGNGRFSSIPSNTDGKYTVSAKNTVSGRTSEDQEISGFTREAWDPASVPTVDVNGINVTTAIGTTEYHYTLTGVKVSAKEGAEIEFYLQDKQKGTLLKGEFDNTSKTWTVKDIKPTESGKYVAYARNITDDADSEEMEIGRFPVLKPIATPSASQLESMYKSGEHSKYSSAFNPGFSFVFSGDPIGGLKPHTNQEICTQLRIHAWDDIKVTKVETDCLGHINRVHINVKNR